MSANQGKDARDLRYIFEVVMNLGSWELDSPWAEEARLRSESRT